MDKSSYKLLVLDIDGTILNREGKISEEDKAALAETERRDIKVTLCTGRTLQSGMRIISLLPLDGYHIFFDGALVTNPVSKEEIFSVTLNKGVVEEMVKLAKELNIRLELFSTGEYFVEAETWSTNVRRKYFGIIPRIVDFDGIWEKERIIKGTVVLFTPEERASMEKLSRHFKKEEGVDFSWTATPAYPNVDFVNIVAPGVTKGKALKALAKHLKISMGQVMAIGDERNDVSLFEIAGFSVAMGNAPAEVKAVARHVTLDVDQSGAAAAIRKFLL